MLHIHSSSKLGKIQAIVIILLLLPIATLAQTTCNGTWGPFILNQTFGQGTPGTLFFGPLSTYAPGVTTSTTFIYGPPGDNYSVLTSNANYGQPSHWCSEPDHTGNPNGLMFEINAPSSGGTVFVSYDMNNLCPNTLLKLSVWIMNVDGVTTTQFPNMTMQVVDAATSSILATVSTGNVPFDCIWHNYTMIFNNGNSSNVILKFINNSVGNGYGNDLAIDDITISPCIPITHISPAIDTTITCAAANITFTANVTGNSYSPAEIQWQYSSDFGLTWINAGATGSISPYTFINSVTGTYWIRFLTGPPGYAANSNCAAVSDTSIVNLVNPGIPVVPVASYTYCQNQLAAQLTATGSNLLWYTTASGGTGSPVAPIPSTSVPGVTTYYVSQTVNVCESNRDSITVTIKVKPSAPSVITPLSYCQGQTASPLTATGINLLWYTSSTGGNGASTLLPSTLTAGSFDYYVSQTLNGCESDRSDITVNVTAKPPIPVVTSPVYYCQGQAAQPLNAVGSNLLWYTSLSSTVGSALTPATPSTNMAGDTTYYVSQTVNGCESDKAAIKVTVYATPAPPLVSDPLILCLGDPAVSLTATGQNLTWYTTPAGGTGSSTAPVPSTQQIDTMAWYVSQTVNGCQSGRTKLDVIVNNKPQVNITALKSVLCRQDTMSVYFTGNNQNTGTLSWVIPAGDTIVNYSNDSENIVVYFGSAGNTTVSLVGTDNICRDTASINVLVSPGPNVNVSMATHICTGIIDKMLITNVDTGVTFHIDFGSANIVDSSYNTYDIEWPDTGVYVVQIIADSRSCPEQVIHDTVTVSQQPDAGIAPLSATDICSGDTIRVSANKINSAYHYTWTSDTLNDIIFNDTDATTQVIIATSAYIKLTTRLGPACVAEDSVAVSPHPCCELYVPSAFTPNADGKNDIFRILTIGHHKIIDFRIFDRWGQVVFETIKEGDGWDGKFKGVDMELGVYDYFIRYQCADGRTYEKKGDLTLVR